MRFVSEAVVVDRMLRGRRLGRGGRRFVARLLSRLLAARGERSEADCETSQRERELHYFQPDLQRPDRFQHFSDSCLIGFRSSFRPSAEDPRNRLLLFSSPTFSFWQNQDRKM